jgi:hypothetical protein
MKNHYVLQDSKFMISAKSSIKLDQVDVEYISYHPRYFGQKFQGGIDGVCLWGTLVFIVLGYAIIIGDNRRANE